MPYFIVQCCTYCLNQFMDFGTLLLLFDYIGGLFCSGSASLQF